MGRIVAFEHITLDGVMQAPGRPDEDRRGDFPHGGWAAANNDHVMNSVIGAGMSGMSGTAGASKTTGILLGRRTYEDFYAFWPKQQANPFTEALNHTPKYVTSRTLRTPLAWQNSTLLSGDAADSVATLKQESDLDLIIFGSGELVHALMRRHLIDEFLLMIHPLVFGTGRRLFAGDGTFLSLKLVDTKPTKKGVIIATYHLKT
jgi:dihydrofolate reductase